MESRLKERLTGAAILVALIVLVVPEIFSGRPAQVDTSRAPPALEGAPVRSYTIDLNASGTQATPLQLSGAPAAVPVPAAVPPRAAVPSRAAVPPRAAVTATTPARSAPAAGEVASVHASTHAGAQASVQTSTTGASGWSVQLGVFSKAANATRLAQTAHGKGFPVRVSRSSRGLYRVALVGLSSRTDALRASRRLRAAGLPAAVLGPR